MFIQTEETPNPLAMKFIPGKDVMKEGTLTVASKEDAWKSPLVELLFEINGVAEVFLSSDFISVTKTQDYDWNLLKPQVLGNIMEYFMENDEVIIRQDPNDPSQSESDFDESNLDEDTKEIIAEIRELIETRIRPAVAQDGGDITFERFVDGIVYLKMHGACSGCPSSTITLKNGVENMLRHYVPEVNEVKAI